MAWTRHQMIRARVSLRESEDAMLVALSAGSDAERFAERCAEAFDYLAEAAADLGFKLEKIEGEKELAA